MKRISVMLAVLLAVTMVLAACGRGTDRTDGTTETTRGTTAPASEVANGEDPKEGPDTNNGRPFNATPIAWDGRDADKYLHGVNLTVLPIVDEPVEIEVWRGFSSTIMTSLDESEPFQEAERRTGVKIRWFHPPVGQETDNFMLRISSDDLPHIFSNPPGYPGGPAMAVEEEVYLDLTPFYEAGLMPNYSWLRNNHADAEEISRGTVDDLGRILSFIMLDIVPSHPWSGLWIRQDYLDDFGFNAPTTIDEWDQILRAWREEKGTFVLGHSLDAWYGVQTNFAFAGTYGAGFRSWLNMDGVAAFSSIQPGYRDYLTLMNSWWEAGILDPDFATRTHDDYFSMIANGGFLAFGLAYGEIGQAKMTGQALDSDWAVTPLPNPGIAPGQKPRLSSQNNSLVRGDRSYVTTRAQDEGLAEVAIRWLDYWYSQDGGDLASYGIHGTSHVWGEDGSVEWIHPSLDTPGADFWTLVHKFKIRPFSFLRDSTAYHFEPEVWECISVWGASDNSWIMSGNITLTPDEAGIIAGIMADVNTHTMEQTLAFITGARPIAQFDAFVSELEGMGIRRAEEIHQAALDRYLSR